jgi:hypothetical protein
MNNTQKSSIAGLFGMAVMVSALTACSSQPTHSSCSMPDGTDLDRAISAAKFDLQTGCEHRFDQYFDHLLAIAEGDPKKDNKSSFSEFLMWANDEGLLSKRQARETYNRYFGIKYVSLVSDYSVCSQTCPRQTEIMRNMNSELGDKEQGLLKISADPVNYYRANRLYQEAELVLEATCLACEPVE